MESLGPSKRVSAPYGTAGSWRGKGPWIHGALSGGKTHHELGVKNCTPHPVFLQEEVNEKTFPFTESKKIFISIILTIFIRFHGF